MSISIDSKNIDNEYFLMDFGLEIVLSLIFLGQS